MPHEKTDAVVARARTLLRAGKARKARALLISSLPDDGPERAARRELAELARAVSSPSEAGRWGVLFPEWVSEREVRDLRRWLLGRSADDFDYVRELLVLRTTDPLPPVVEDLVAPEFRAPRETPDRQPSTRDRIGCWSIAIAAIAGLAAIGSIGAVVFAVALRNPDAGTRAQVLFWPTVGCLAICVVAALVLTAANDDAPQMDEQRATPPDASHLLTLARRRAVAGDEREAEIILRALLRGFDEHEVEEAARRALVEMSRARQRSAEAGRWGIGVPGLSTPAEREAFAAAIATAPDLIGRLRTLSASRPGMDSLAADDVLRRAHRRSGATGPAPTLSRSEPDHHWRETAVQRLGCSGGVVLGSTALITWIATLTGWWDGTTIFWIGLTASLVPVVAAVALDTWADIRRRLEWTRSA